MLTPRLDSVEALFRKLEREGYRAFHTKSASHKADHFYNFCVTAQSLRDFLLERLGKILPAQQQPHHDAWSKLPALRAIKDIAETAKHFQLRERNRTRAVRTPKTRGVRQGTTTIVEVYIDSSGLNLIPKRRRTPTYYVEMEDGSSAELYAFTDQVVSFWKGELSKNGIRLQRQSIRSLSGSVA